jgi:hypothetical protein
LLYWRIFELWWSFFVSWNFFIKLNFFILRNFWTFLSRKLNKSKNLTMNRLNCLINPSKALSKLIKQFSSSSWSLSSSIFHSPHNKVFPSHFITDFLALINSRNFTFILPSPENPCNYDSFS